MNKEKRKEYSADELVSLLKHTHDSPIILVEGSTDMRIYDCLEQILGLNGSLIACGGRQTLLSVFERRAEFPTISAVFIADRDFWYFEPIPSIYEGVIFTTGYSIENDAIAGSEIFNLYNDRERANREYRDICNILSGWWAYVVEEHLCGKNPKCDWHLNRLIREKDGRYFPTDDCSTQVRLAPRELRKSIENNFEYAMRGHQLEQIHQRLLHNINNESYQSSQICKTICALNPSPTFIDLCKRVEAALERQRPSE